MCEVVEEAGVLKCNTTDLAPGGGVLGSVIGVSEDGSWVYFAANGVLGSDPGAVHGTCVSELGSAGRECNLYVEHSSGAGWEAPKLVAVLSGEDAPDWVSLDGPTARVSPDGGWLAFMSQERLTGYDNTDAVSGKPDEEVFLYDAAKGEVVCASCNPSGARPHGIEYNRITTSEGGLAGGDRIWGENQWIAGSVPGWTPYALERVLYQSRYLSDSGRLFFNSPDGLVPSDSNGTEDVYEYEPEGDGAKSGHPCTPASTSPSEVFKPAHTYRAEDGASGEGRKAGA